MIHRVVELTAMQSPGGLREGGWQSFQVHRWSPYFSIADDVEALLPLSDGSWLQGERVCQFDLVEILSTLVDHKIRGCKNAGQQ